jgi:hypothetical protein
MASLHTMELQVTEDKTVTSMTWKLNNKTNSDGLYFVRCSVKKLIEDIM